MSVRYQFLLAAVASVAMIACSGGEKTSEQPPAATPQAAAPASGGPLTPGPGGKIISVELTTDEKGVNKFTPNKIEAMRAE
jgi:hypothetical protein